MVALLVTYPTDKLLPEIPPLVRDNSPAYYPPVDLLAEPNQASRNVVQGRYQTQPINTPSSRSWSQRFQIAITQIAGIAIRMCDIAKGSGLHDLREQIMPTILQRHNHNPQSMDLLALAQPSSINTKGLEDLR